MIDNLIFFNCVKKVTSNHKFAIEIMISLYCLRDYIIYLHFLCILYRNTFYILKKEIKYYFFNYLVSAVF